MEPGLAFGTGGHNTTRLCLETLESYVTPETELLDIGCGSGILSLCALLLGAKSATGVDIDALAVKTAVENGRENGFSAPRFTVLQGDLTEQVKGRFDIVVANIVADVIIRFCKDVRQFMKPGAVLSPPASSTPARRTFLLPSRNTALPFRSAMRMAVGSASFARHEPYRRRWQISAYIFLTFILAVLLCERPEYDTLSTIKFNAGNCIASGRRIFRTEPSIYNPAFTERMI